MANGDWDDPGFEPLADIIRNDFFAELGKSSDPADAPRIAEVVTRNFGISEMVRKLGRGAFGVAVEPDSPVTLPDVPIKKVIPQENVVIKITSDPEEIQAAANLVGQELKHVVHFYGSYVLRDYTVINVNVYDDLLERLDEEEAERVARTRIGITVQERLASVGIEKNILPGVQYPFKTINRYLKAVRETKDKYGVWPDQLSRIGRVTQRRRLKMAQEYLVHRLALMATDKDDPFPPAREIADGLAEMYELGIYGVDVHGNNVGQDTYGKWKVFDVGVSSSPRRKEPVVLVNPVGYTTINNPEYVGWPATPISNPDGRIIELY